MIGIFRSLGKILMLFVFVYLFTLTLSLFQIAKTIKSGNDMIRELREASLNQSEIEKFSEQLKSASSTLGSIILKPVALAIGEPSAISDISSLGNSTAKALQILAPIVNRDVEEIRLSNTEVIVRDSKLLTRADPHIRGALDDFNDLEFKGILKFQNSRLKAAQLDLRRINETYSRLAPLLPIVPDLLGNINSRKYFVAIQNSAQARGTGGFAGVYALVEFAKGNLTINRVAPLSELRDLSQIPIDVPQEYRDIYLDYPKSWGWANLSPHFPYAARIWSEAYRVNSGVELDGVIAVDVFLMRALLASTGPVNLNGVEINQENVIDEVLSKAYRRYANDPGKRRNYLADISREVAQRFADGNFSRRELLKELINPVLEDRILLYSKYPREAKYISLSPISGILDDQANNEFRLIIQNIAGNKMDYYVSRELTVLSEQCSPIRTTRVDFTIGNTAKRSDPLTPYVNSIAEQGYPRGFNNAHFVGIFLYGPSNARITGVIDRDSGKTYGWVFTERKRPLYSVQVMIPAEGKKNFSVYFEGGTGAISTRIQPLVQPQKTTIADGCRQ